MAVAAGFNQDAGGQGGLAGDDLPDVQVVDLDAVGLGDESAAEAAEAAEGDAALTDPSEVVPQGGRLVRGWSLRDSLGIRAVA